MSVADADALLKQMYALTPPGSVISSKIIGYHSFIEGNHRTVDLTFEDQYAEKWLLTTVGTRTDEDQKVLLTFRAVAQNESVEEQNRFTWKGKSWPQFLMLAFALLSLCVSFYTCYRVVRLTSLRYRWVWVILALIGFGRVNLNWTTGAVSANLIWLGIPTMHAFQPLYGPWLISVLFPVGAIVVLLKIRTVMYRSHDKSPEASIHESFATMS